MNASTRSTAKAGQLQAGQPLDDLRDLLAPRTVAEAEQALALIDERRAVAETAAEAHAAGRDDALIEGAERQHDDHARALADDVRRLTVAAERLAARRDELTEQARAAAGQDAAEKARKLQAEGIAELQAIDAAAAALAAQIGRYSGLCNSIEAANRTAVAGGADAMLLPHVALSEPDRFESIEVEIDNRGARLTDAAGQAVSAGGGRRWGPVDRPVEPVATQRTETRYQRGRKTLDPRTAGFILPRLDGARHYLRQD